MITRSVIYRGRVRAIEDAVEAWKASHDDALEVHDLEDVVREWLGTMDLLAQWQADSWKQLFAGELKKIQGLGRLLRMAYRSSLDVAGLLEECVAWAEGNGYAVDNARDFRQRRATVERLYQDFETRWPFPDKKQIEAGMASLDRGEGADLGGWIRELQGEDRPGG